MELQGVESFDNGQAVLRFRFKTAPLRQWEVQRAFNLRLRRRLDQAGLEPSMPRLNVQLSRMRQSRNPERDEASTSRPDVPGSAAFDLRHEQIALAPDRLDAG